MADRWDNNSYIVIEVPNEGVPVSRIQRESGDSTEKTLHTRMLLPFSTIPSSLDLGLFYDSPHSATSKHVVPVEKSQILCKNLNLSLTLLNPKQKNYLTQDVCFL